MFLPLGLGEPKAYSAAVGADSIRVIGPTVTTVEAWVTVAPSVTRSLGVTVTSPSLAESAASAIVVSNFQSRWKPGPGPA